MQFGPDSRLNLEQTEENIILDALNDGQLLAMRGLKFNIEDLEKQAEEKYGSHFSVLYIENYQKAFNEINNRMSDKDRAIVNGHYRGYCAAHNRNNASIAVFYFCRSGWGKYTPDFKISFIESLQRSSDDINQQLENYSKNDIGSLESHIQPSISTSAMKQNLSEEERKVQSRARLNGSHLAANGRKLNEENLKKYVMQKKWSTSWSELYINNYKEAFYNGNAKMCDKNRAMAAGHMQGYQAAHKGKGVSKKLDSYASAWGEYAKDYKESYCKIHQEIYEKNLSIQEEKDDSDTNKNEVLSNYIFSKKYFSIVHKNSFSIEADDAHVYLPMYNTRSTNNNDNMVAQNHYNIKNNLYVTSFKMAMNRKG